MEHITDSLKTAGKILVPTVAGVASTFSEWEPIIRMICLLTTTALSIVVFYRNYKKSKKIKNNEKEVD